MIMAAPDLEFKPEARLPENITKPKKTKETKENY